MRSMIRKALVKEDHGPTGSVEMSGMARQKR